MNVLELAGVTKSYGEVDALKDVDLSVPAGQWLSIMGPSGSGKTTLMNIVGCLDTPTAGSVVLDGVDLASMDAAGLSHARRNTIGLVFQKFHLVNHLTAVENVMVAQYYHSMPDEAEALAALDRVGLRQRAHHLPSQLSGGEQQRVCIARALINYPRVVLADEPTGNLDEANERLVLDFFGQLHAEGTTLIVVTHDPEVAALGDRQVVLNHGRIVREVDNRTGTAR
ncbi:MAG: ABC transporter ATP-binding protein [Propionicimonas sp.]|nr:ABC transporter ATP-binding protein [Propionicimonas sp.]